MSLVYKRQIYVVYHPLCWPKNGGGLFLFCKKKTSQTDREKGCNEVNSAWNRLLCYCIKNIEYPNFKVKCQTSRLQIKIRKFGDNGTRFFFNVKSKNPE